MKHKRNVDGLRENAQKKRKEAFDRVDCGIKELIKQKKKINFNTVAEAAGVSKAFLYKEPEIKERIEQLRAQSTGKKSKPKQSASDASKDAIIRTLKERIKKLNTENHSLRKQNQVAYGQVMQLGQVREQLTRCEVENEQFRQRLNQQNSLAATVLTEVEAEIVGLGVPLNSTLKKLISNAPPKATCKAVNSLKEAMAEGRVSNPSGFLNRAIQDTWQPNENFEAKVERELFNDWYQEAKEAGIVIGATMVDGTQHVYLTSGECVAFEKILEKYPLSIAIREEFDHKPCTNKMGK